MGTLLLSAGRPTFGRLVSFLKITPRLIESALCVVVGLNRLAVLVGGALALSGNVEDLSQLNVAPDFSPARLAIAIQRVAVGIR